MVQASLIAVLVLVLAIPWLGAHFGIIVAGLVFWIGTEMVSPDRKEVAAQAALARTFNAKVTVADEKLNFDDRTISATIRNESGARIYDIWFQCAFHVPETQYNSTDPATRTEKVSSDYDYGYVAPGASKQLSSLKLEQHGLLSRAIPSSIVCEPRYQHETSDLFESMG
jgi:hypothetical protein